MPMIETKKTLATVQDKTESLFELYKSLEIPIIFELNKGNHFTEAALRTAKGVNGFWNNKNGITTLYIAYCTF